MSAVNVVIHPHSSERYIELIRDIFNLRREIPVHGNENLIMRSMQISSDQRWVQGEIAKFTKIQGSDDWFNLQTLEKAEKNELRQIRIPEELRPNLASFSYLFDVAQHMFIFERRHLNKSLSQRMVHTYLSRITEDKMLQEKYSSISVSYVSSEDSVGRVLDMPRLKRVEIIIIKPNPDDLDGLEAEVKERLGRMRAKKMILDYEAMPNTSLKLDDEATKYTRVASRNGEVRSTGKDKNGATIHRSTRDHPLEKSLRYDPDERHRPHVFRSAALRILGEVARDKSKE
ncbi:DUF4747 family protein [Geminicoccaceae bacterium 1502E]|nr:DUF4747 family protein [Geminicoccaceae bacterium 1502E]